jgi:hypothetical protein
MISQSGKGSSGRRKSVSFGMNRVDLEWLEESVIVNNDWNPVKKQLVRIESVVNFFCVSLEQRSF